MLFIGSFELTRFLKKKQKAVIQHIIIIFHISAELFVGITKLN